MDGTATRHRAADARRHWRNGFIAGLVAAMVLVLPCCWALSYSPEAWRRTWRLGSRSYSLSTDRGRVFFFTCDTRDGSTAFRYPCRHLWRLPGIAVDLRTTPNGQVVYCILHYGLGVFVTLAVLALGGLIVWWRRTRRTVGRSSTAASCSADAGG